MKVLPISCRCKLTDLAPQVRRHLFLLTASRRGATPPVAGTVLAASAPHLTVAFRGQ